VGLDLVRELQRASKCARIAAATSVDALMPTSANADTGELGPAAHMRGLVCLLNIETTWQTVGLQASKRPCNAEMNLVHFRFSSSIAASNLT
jgi:hypothetical protein